MTFSNAPSPGVALQGGGGGSGSSASAPLTGTGATITASTPLIDTTQTWNNAAVTFTGWKLNITDTTSAAGSLLIDAQVGGTTQFSVSKAGAAVIKGSLVVGDNNGTFGAITCGIGQTTGLIFGNRGRIYASNDGLFAVVNNAGTSFSRFCFGGTTASFPAVKRTTTILQVRLADDTAYAPVEASTVRMATAYTVATLPAAGSAGRMAYVTDATAPTFLGALTGGGAVVCPVFDNGTAWVAG